jgi:hypothetical protein
MGFLGISGNTWKKVGKVALKAAPIVAAPFTGGASLLALGAGTGALSGALGGGGWKGALLGAGLGAIPGGGAGGAVAGGAAKAGLKEIAKGVAKGAATNFATGTATGLATGQGVKNSFAAGGQGALSGVGTQGAGGFGQAAKTIGTGVAKNVGGSFAARGLQQAGVPGALAAQGGNVFSNYLGNQFTSPATRGTTNPAIGSFLPQPQAPASPASGAGGGWKNALMQAGTGALTGAFNGSGGGTTAPPTGSGTGAGGAGAAKPPTWLEKYGPLIAQGAGVAIGGYVGKKAQQSAAQRSPEEQAALAGAQRSADQAGQLGGQLAQRGLNYQEKPAQYFQSLLGGNRAAMSQAVAAPTAQLTGTYRGATRALDQAGVRGAARDQAVGDLNRDRASKIASLTTGVQPYAAEQLAGMGRDTLGQAPGLIGTAGNIYGGLLGQGNANRINARAEGERTASAIGGLARDMGEVVFRRPQAGAVQAPPSTSTSGRMAPMPPEPLGASTARPNTVSLPGSVPLGAAPAPTPSWRGVPNRPPPGYPFGSQTGDYRPWG